MSVRKKKKGLVITILLIVIFLAGLSLVLYPVFSDYWNSFRQTREIASYERSVSVYSLQEYEDQWNRAVRYNEDLAQNRKGFELTVQEYEEYDSLLNIGENGVMGYIEIPSISVSLPIYHGTSTGVLQRALGHLEWTSLPVGGESSHCVISGHRGLPSAKLFTNLDKLVEGDLFVLKVMNEALTYQVDQILIVEPDDTKNLQIIEGEDLCTLVTCTPYGINTHRLLVRGHHVESMQEADSVYVSADAVQVNSSLIAAIIAVPLFILFLVIVFIYDRKQKDSDAEEE